MLMSDLQHDFVNSFVSVLSEMDWSRLNELVTQMRSSGSDLLARESIPQERRRFYVRLDCRYVKQYHEVSLPVELDSIRNADNHTIAAAFHAEHERLYGYSLEREGTPIELINVRVRAVGVTEKPAYAEEPYAGPDPSPAAKGERAVFIPDDRAVRPVQVYDGHRTRHGNRITGPALIEQVNTTVLLSAAYDCVCDKYGSFIAFTKGYEDRLPSTIREVLS
jgi:N-methylhydantoinase A